MSQSSLKKHERTFDQNESGVWSATLEDSAGNPVQLADVTSISLSLFLASDVTSIINSRDRQDVLNVANCTFHATSGLLTWRIQSEDNPIVATTLTHGATEKHRAVFECKFGTDGSVTHVIDILVREVANVPNT